MDAVKITLAITITTLGLHFISAESPERNSTDPDVKIAEKVEAADNRSSESPPKPRKEPKTIYLSGNPETVDYVRKRAAKRGWKDGQWDALNELIHNESSWDPYAQNPTSTACGLFQSIDCEYELGNVQQQTKWGLDYIADRYGNPAEALYFWKHIAPTKDINGDGVADNHNWY